MRTTDHDICPLGEIIPFQPRAATGQSDVKVSVIATLVAVSVLHDTTTNPEEKLLELIEQSGEAEILDALDATADLEQDEALHLHVQLNPVNDNSRLTDMSV
ncbi:MAG: hypothetical protein ACON4F_08520 [Candidatus Puniceispirillaceae bacterium]